MKIEREALLEKLEELKSGGFAYLTKITAVDYVEYLEVVYFLEDMERYKNEVVKVDVLPGDAWVPTVMELYGAADWYEREMAEMFGIEIRGRKTKRLLLEKWDGKQPPLRKEFAWGKKYESYD